MFSVHDGQKYPTYPHIPTKSVPEVHSQAALPPVLCTAVAASAGMGGGYGRSPLQTQPRPRSLAS
jgi:hypothetical protein